jgi:dTMP kinase
MTAGADVLDKRARTIALIGIDGSGKTTQVGRLAEWARAQGHAPIVHPNESLGRIKSQLSRLAAEDDLALDDYLGVDLSQILAAVLKWNTLAKVADVLACPGNVVLFDRYSYCQLAAARRAGWHARELIEGLYRVFPPPDLTVLLEVDPELAAARIEARGGELVDLPFLEFHAAAYKALPEAGTFVVVDAGSSQEVVWQRVVDAVRARLPFLAEGSARGTDAPWRVDERDVMS